MNFCPRGGGGERTQEEVGMTLAPYQFLVDFFFLFKLSFLLSQGILEMKNIIHEQVQKAEKVTNPVRHS